MNPIHIVNAGALILALGLGAATVARTAAVAPASVAFPAADVVSDAVGVAVPVRPYARIVSLSLVADAVLAAVADPQRVVAVSAYGTGDLARRWTGRPRLPGLEDLEAILALRPDLVLVSTYGGEADRLTRLREAGITVFALGPMEGLDTYRRDAAAIGAVIGQPGPAAAHAEALAGRLARVAAVLPAGAPRPRALYLATYGDALFGGTVGSSYHDVLTAAGCTDSAASSFRGWPQFSTEQVVLLAPEVIVTKQGMAAALRRRPALGALTVRWVEVSGDLLEDPGPGMLDAAEAIFAQVHGPALPDAHPLEAARP